MEGKRGKAALRRLGTTIRRYRLQARFTQTEFALHALLERTQVSSMERGEGNPTLSTLVRVSSAVGMTLTEFLRPIDKWAAPSPEIVITNADPAAAIAANVRRFRTRARLTQERLAHDADVERGQVSAIENARPGLNPTLGTLIKLGDVLQVDVSVLVQMPGDLAD